MNKITFTIMYSYAYLYYREMLTRPWIDTLLGWRTWCAISAK